ncbi:uncharacterized protein DDB_G0280205-like [Folsomia candida]|nr:uncharacterized protein DDB_G0280205-like [Folsomia candida]
MSTTPKKREHIGIKAKIYNSPESLSMEEAYHKVYSSRNRYGNRSEQPHDFSPNQDLYQLRLYSEEGKLTKVVSEDGNDFDHKLAGDKVDVNNTNNNEMSPDEQKNTSPEIHLDEIEPSSTKITKDSITAAKRNVSVTSNLNQILSPTMADSATNDPPTRETLDQIPSNLSSEFHTPRDDPILPDNVIPDPIPTGEKISGQHSSSSISSAASNKTVVFNDKQTNSQRKHQSPYKLRAQSPYKSALKNAKTTQSSDSVMNKMSNTTPMIKTPISGNKKFTKIPIPITPKFTPKERQNFAPITRPLKARGPLHLSDLELSPMPSPTTSTSLNLKTSAVDKTIKNEDEKIIEPQKPPPPKPTPKITPTKHSCIGVQQPPKPTSYLEKQQAKMQLAKKIKTINTLSATIQRRVKPKPAADWRRNRKSLQGNKFASNSIQQQSSCPKMSTFSASSGTILTENHEAGISEQYIPTLYDSGEDEKELEQQLEEGKSSPQTDGESTTVVFKMGNDHELSPSVTSAPENVDVSRSEIDAISDQVAESIPIKIEDRDDEAPIAVGIHLTTEHPQDIINQNNEAHQPFNLETNFHRQTLNDSVEVKNDTQVQIVKVPCRFTASGCKEMLVRGTLSEDNHHRECQFRPISCILLQTCNETVPYHSFNLHFSTHYLCPTYAKTLTTRIPIASEAFNVEYSWLPKWLRVGHANFFVMMNHTLKGKSIGEDGHWMFWVWMIGSQEEASKFFYEIEICKDHRKKCATFTTQSIRTTTAQIFATKSCLCVTDEEMKRILCLEDKLFTDLFIDVAIVRKPSSTVDTTPSYTGKYRDPR